MSEYVDCVVVGAGVIGVAIARQLQLSGREVYVLESSSRIGQGVSARNSEVIHAGIYYPKNSLKARLCAKGRDLLYRYCEQRKVPVKRLGKIIVATNSKELSTLEKLAVTAQSNGVTDLRLLTETKLRGLEPELQATAGLLSPQSGIVDSVALIENLSADFESAGGRIVTNSMVERGDVTHEGIRLRIQRQHEPVVARTVINAAGLCATNVARSIEGMPAAVIPTPKYAIGHYYNLVGPAPFSRLIYPVPSDGGLGIHFIIDTRGGSKFGPDVRWLSSINYAFDDSQRDSFIRAIERYYPNVRQRRLMPGYTGIRPKVADARGLIDDFVIQDESAHGIPGLINLFGIESPGLTAALAIGEQVLLQLAHRENSEKHSEQHKQLNRTDLKDSRDIPSRPTQTVSAIESYV